MISRTKASEYFCTKQGCTGHAVSMAGQKKACWLCGTKMREKKAVNVEVKSAKA